MSEQKVYVINASESSKNFREIERLGHYNIIMDEAERLGSVYSLEGFQEAINDEYLDLSNSFIYISKEKEGMSKKTNREKLLEAIRESFEGDVQAWFDYLVDTEMSRLEEEPTEVLVNFLSEDLATVAEITDIDLEVLKKEVSPTKKRYTISVAIEDIDAICSHEALQQAKKMVEAGKYDLEVVDEYEVTEG